MRFLIALPLVAASLATAAPVVAQTAVEARVDRLEREMRAIQRRVFPGGATNQVEPQITAPDSPLEAPGTPASGPFATLTARIDAIEQQQASLLGQIEQAQFKLRQLEESFASYRRATDARLSAADSAGNPAGDDGAPPAAAPIGNRGPGNGGGTLGSGPRPASPPSGATPIRTGTDPARAAQISAVERPSTGDAAEDGYVYGYRLWQAKLYPEAQAELKTVVDRFPRHRRASYAQNLIGRAYLDDGKPSLASVAFYENYKKMPDGDRAPDSLLYLAHALMQLKKPKEACDVYGELTDVYAGKIGSAMQADITRGRTAAKCTT